jgi:hypothetical protein
LFKVKFSCVARDYLGKHDYRFHGDKMKRIHFRTVIFGLLISWGVEALVPLIHTILDFVVSINLRYPLTHYLLWGYLAVVLSGIYIGFSKATNKVINGMVVGIFYYIGLSLFIGLVTDHHLGMNLLSFGYALLKRGFICALAAWSSYRIKGKLGNPGTPY